MYCKRAPFASAALAALVSLGMTAAQAHAASSDALAEITGFTLQLIDLDLSDGIAPSISFHDGVRRAGAFELFNNVANARSDYGSAAVASPFGAARASLSESALSAAVNVSSSKHGDQNFKAEALRYAPFTLSPSTGLLLTARATIRANQWDIVDQAYYKTNAGVNLWARLDNSSGGVDGHEFIERAYSTTEGERSYTLSAYLTTGERAQEGWLQIAAGTETFISSPVPEPATWGMLLAGAAIVGTRLRRRG